MIGWTQIEFQSFVIQVGSSTRQISSKSNDGSDHGSDISLMDSFLIGFSMQGWGEEGWEKVVQRHGHENVAKLSSCPYPDDGMYSIIVIASETLGTTINSMLEQYGRYFLRHLFAQGYGNMLRCLGSSLPDFLGSLNDMHVHFSLSYEHMIVPVFSVDNATSTSLE